MARQALKSAERRNRRLCHSGCGRFAEPMDEYCFECQLDGKAPPVTYRRSLEDPKHEHCVTCMLCGRGYFVRMTEKVAKLHQTAGTVPDQFAYRAIRASCTTCGGVLMIERADLGGIGPYKMRDV